MEGSLQPLERAEAKGEVRWLKAAQALGFPVAPTWVVTLEEEFYRLNNLPERIERLFQGVFGPRTDEERLLWALEEAQRAVRESYLLPERAEAFLKALRGPGPFLVRREGEPAFLEAPTPQEALWALKRLWGEAFRLEALLARPHLLPPFRPCLVQEAGPPEEDPYLSLEISQALGREVVAYAHRGRLVHLEVADGG